MNLLFQIFGQLFPDRRREAEIKRESEFIEAVNKLKTLRVERGVMSIDPEEIRDQILRSREAVKHLVDPAHRKRPRAGAAD